MSDFVACDGTRDETANFTKALAAAAGGSLVIPSQCIIRFASPGAGNTVATLPTNTAILCEDQTAGFAVARQRCVGGTYVDAACTTSAECLGGGTCTFDFGAATFAPTGGSTYTIFKDAGSATQDITIENCSFWTAQADPYQRCVAGTNAGKPCRQECQGGTFPGFRCQADVDCTGGGTCLRIADCATPGGTCAAAPGNPAGPGKINPLDLTNTYNARIINVSVYDHFIGDFSIKTGNQATMRDTHVAREVTDCTTPFPGVPANSNCQLVGTSTNLCCYGALNFSTSNTQPTTSVTNGVVVGANSQLIRTTGRGSTTAIDGGSLARLDECTVWPASAQGPGTASNGYKIGATGQVAKSQALFLASGGTGVLLNGANAAAIRNNIQRVTGAGVGVSSNSDYAFISGNYVEGDAATGAGISVTAGNNSVVQGNQINSNAVDLLQTGIKLAGAYHIITDNQIDRTAKAGVWISGNGSGLGITSNRIQLTAARTTTALQPIHVLTDGGAYNIRMTGNTLSNGWRGIAQGTSVVGYNVQIIGNRFQGLTGAAVAHGGAGINVVGNYINPGFAGAGGPSLTCDATCSTGNGRGNVCQQDSNCATCNASVKKCIPEPIAGYFGNPQGIYGSDHNQWLDNLLYYGFPADVVATTAVKQCTAGTNPGALCTVDPCAAAATCSGGPPATCQSGADVGKRCCAGGGGCTARTQVPWLRFLDYGQAVTHQEGIVATNTIFGVAANTDAVGLDMVSSFSLPNMTIKKWQVAGNNFSAPSATNTTAIKFPTDATAATKVTEFQVGDQAFLGGWANTLQSYQWSFGSYLPQNGVILVGEALTLATANPTTNWFPFSGPLTAAATEAAAQFFAALPMTIWKMTCQVSAAPGGTSVRTFMLRKAGADTAMTCAITGAATQCNTAAGAASAPIVVTAGQLMAYRQVISVAAATAANGSCYALVTYGNTF